MNIQGMLPGGYGVLGNFGTPDKAAMWQDPSFGMWNRSAGVGAPGTLNGMAQTLGQGHRSPLVGLLGGQAMRMGGQAQSFAPQQQPVQPTPGAGAGIDPNWLTRLMGGVGGLL